ncbi:MAG: Holliday junction branch migration protein RuvA [Lentisphaeria bacterium]|nr:Holliday junction branch migration protein RuvA [Lentisphaeria bacterium]
MIARLRGSLLESSYTACVIEAGGVGYEAASPLSTFEKLPHTGEEVSLFIHTQVREDAISLFGFATAEERALFRLLISVSGIGGKLALNVLSAMPAANFCQAVTSGDIKMLSRINGIGRRTAERLVVELKEKLSDFSSTPAGIPAAAPEVMSAMSDAALALEQLGYKREEIDKVLRKLSAKLPEDGAGCENLLRKALQLLNF